MQAGVAARARGAIPHWRAEAQPLARRILQELRPDPARIGGAIFADLPDLVDFAGWQRIDAQERALAPADRCRRKISTWPELLRAATLQDA